MDMFQCISARCNEPSRHGYCSNYSSISSSNTNSISINNEEELMMSIRAMCKYDTSDSLGFFLPEEEEEEQEYPLITAIQSDTNPLSSTSNEQDEDNEVVEEEEEERKEKEEYKREEEVEEEEDRREKEEEGRRRKRKRVKISKDPQSVAARNRRHRISQKMRVLRKLVPGGMKMDTASMLDEAAQYLKRLKAQVRSMETVMNALENGEPFLLPFSVPMPMEFYY